MFYDNELIQFTEVSLCTRFPYHLEYYTEVLDLNKLLDIDDDDPFMQKYHTLNEYVLSYWNILCSFGMLILVLTWLLFIA